MEDGAARMGGGTGGGRVGGVGREGQEGEGSGCYNRVDVVERFLDFVRCYKSLFHLSLLQRRLFHLFLKSGSSESV